MPWQPPGSWTGLGRDRGGCPEGRWPLPPPDPAPRGEDARRPRVRHPLGETPRQSPAAPPVPSPSEPDPGKRRGTLGPGTLLLLLLAPMVGPAKRRPRAPGTAPGRAVTARLAGVRSEYFILHNITTQRCCFCTASA